MPAVTEILSQLEKKGSAQTRKIYARHGAPVSDMFGCKVADMKTIAKQIKGEQELACELYQTGNADAMYLAGIVADGSQMTKRTLDQWARQANWYMISEYAVPAVAAESHHARDLALKWMKAKKEHVAACGWATYSALLSVTPDDELDLKEVRALLDEVAGGIHEQPNRVRYAMNQFVICVGSYVKPLLAKAKQTAKKIGKVQVDVGETACKVPLATETIAKVETMGRVGKKRKSAKC